MQENTTLTDEAKHDVIKESNVKWEQGKYVKKKNSRPYEDDEEMLKELSQDLVPPEQWEYMLEVERNAKNISQYEWPHQLGRMPLLELKKQDEEIAPCRIDLFGMSCTRNGKPPVNQHISNLIKEMRDSISRVPEGEQTREIEETVWTEFMGADSRDLVSGYMSPEYAINGVFSMKTDIFSFGVLLLEIVTG
ncbi:hypothetical protein BUALT_Bualt03G0162900 [Buddleja alternifolia]|uniref:Protein kinase domain-containing protein n=1 Tax=Buddleja alternifolia TaxID=168488 RepID=A0AAV6XWG4_9LAMI|nr:hypothetical protein BUALT_Bualt03G0162900 [Buddleja alternifolia]